MALPVLHRVCHGTSNPSTFQKSLLTIQPALLPHYRRHKVRGCDYPAIMATSSSFPTSSSAETGAGDCVRGTYVTGLTDGDIWRLDIFEGDEYKRKRVQVRVLETGEEVEAETYVWIAGRARLEEEEWDFGEFVREKMGRWVGCGQEYEGELRPSILGGCVGKGWGA